MEEEQNKIKDVLQKGLLGQLKENQAKLGLEEPNLDKSKQS